MPECGIEGWAKVLGIGKCPQISPRPGPEFQLVTATFKHHAKQILDVYIAGEKDSIGTTPNHPFWSVDKQKFIRADELTPGEHVQKADGTFTTVTQITPQVDANTVFNLEVQCTHTYHVANSGVLVHNGNTCGNEVAFGFSRKLPEFKKKFPNAKDYSDLGLDPYSKNFSSNLRSAMDDADVIRFDVSGMEMLTGSKGVLTGPRYYNTLGSTNWELRTIFDNPALRAKTSLYQNGVLKTFEELLEGL